MRIEHALNLDQSNHGIERSIANRSRIVHPSILRLSACGFFLSSCNLSHTISAEDEPFFLPTSGPARLIPAKGTILRLGSDDPQAAPEERPGWTRFAHDFWMDTTEVTQKEYASLMKRNPSSTKGDALPVHNVTWFDAVLAANARSKRDGLDTVYQYNSASIVSDSGVFDLGGLSIHFERSGWRLPTEAEWELASRAGSVSPYEWGTLADSARASRFAWHQSNSGGYAHPVATLAANPWGLHDMAGNVIEWTGDWKGPFPTDTAVGFAGSESADDLGDIPVKGGAFKFGLSALRPSCRSSTYSSSRASRASYVGFRLVRASFKPTMSSAFGLVPRFPPVDLAPIDLPTLVGTRALRLAFVNRSNGRGILSWIDYGESSLQVRTIPDSFPVFHPAISPDGNWIAWCTVMEGSRAPSRIRIRRLTSGLSTTIDLGEGAIPRWWISGKDTFLIRAEAMDNLLDDWKRTRTSMRRWRGGVLETSDQHLASGSFHDGRSGNFLYTGSRRLIQHDLKSETDRILFTAPENGKFAGDTSQVCNVSVDPEGTGSLLFLDFGFNGKSNVVGRPYGIHEIAFLSDSSGHILTSIPAPPGEQQWDHLEWSNAKRWAVASVQNGTGTNHAIHLLNLESGSSKQLVSGEDLWQPSLWIDKRSASGFSVDFDSAGKWTSPQTRSTMEFAEKSQVFSRNREHVKYVFLGSSRVRLGLTSASFSAGYSFNWGMTACEILCSESVLEQYVIPQAPNLEGVLMSMESGWWFELRTQIWPEIESTTGYQFDKSHAFWKDGPPDEYIQTILSRKFPVAGHDSLGNLLVPLVGQGWGQAACVPPTTEDTASEPFLSNWQNLLHAIDVLESRRIHLLLVNFPQNPAYKNLPQCSGTWEPSWKTFKIIQRRIRDLESKHPYFHFYDANKDGLHSFGPMDFVDASHLSGSGARLMTKQVDSMFQSIRASH